MLLIINNGISHQVVTKHIKLFVVYPMGNKNADHKLSFLRNQNVINCKPKIIILLTISLI